MRTIRIIFLRTCGQLLKSFSTWVVLAAFLALSGAFFVRALLQGDGGVTPIAALWAVAATPFLPILAALLTMRLIADGRASGRLDLLLSAPILEREIVLGRFLGACLVFLVAVLLYLMTPLVLLPWFAPALRAQISLLRFLPAVFALFLQGLLWCACGLLASACFRQAAVAALASLVLMTALPRMAFEAALAWMPVLRTRLAEMPFEAHVIDLSTGVFDLSSFVFYAILTFFAIFAATKRLALLRLAGRGGLAGRLSTGFVVFLALVFSCLVIAVTLRAGLVYERPSGVAEMQLSERTRAILAEARGDISVTCFLPRRSPAFKAVSRLMRGLAASAEVSGIRLTVEYVDPRWDLAKAMSLVQNGVPEGTLVFRDRGGRRHRSVKVSVDSLFRAAASGEVVVSSGALFAGEAICASALQRLSHPHRAGKIYWTVGHGESDFQEYDDPNFGLSDIARELRGDGYRLEKLDLTAVETIPTDCAVVVVAGAREPFSRQELSRLSGYLRTGGRLFVLTSSLPNAGVGPLLSEWGVRILPYTVVSRRTLTGTDVVATDFADHRISSQLTGTMLVFSGAAPLIPAADLSMERQGADRSEFVALVKSDAKAWGESEPDVLPWTFEPTREPGGPLVLAAAVERGGPVAQGVAVRPTRLVVVGDATFVSNGALVQRANANRDFFLNAMGWLAGFDQSTSVRAPGTAVMTGLDRSGWVRVLCFSAVGVPLVVLLLGLLGTVGRRLRA